MAQIPLDNEDVESDNYEDVESIDWKEVAGREEVKGHTEVSLHYYFGAYMIQRARLKLNGEIGNITLRHIQMNVPPFKQIWTVLHTVSLININQILGHTNQI